MSEIKRDLAASGSRSTTSYSPPEEAVGTHTSALALLNAIVRERRVIAWCAAVVGALALAIGIILPKSYVAKSQFAPASGQAPMGRLSGLASQLGLSVGAGDSESPEFYARLLETRAILRDAVLSRYGARNSSGAGAGVGRTLLNYYELDGKDTAEAISSAIEHLSKDVETSIDAKSGIVTLRTRAPAPRVAEQVNARLLELLNEFNLRKRRSRASQERQFVEERLAQARADLDAAERSLASFSDRNRSYRESPQLALEAQRLQRDIDLKQQVYATLSQAYEQARVDEVRDLALITVIDSPEGSAFPTRGLKSAVLLGILLGLFLGLGVALCREYFRQQRSRHSDEIEEFFRLRASLGRAMMPWRR